MANVNDPSILNDKNRLLAVEIVLYVMTSIIESFESLEISTKIVSDFTLFILNIQLINKDNMILKFLLYLDKSSSYIPLDKNVYNLSIKNLIDKIYRFLSSGIYELDLSKYKRNLRIILSLFIN